MKKGFSLIEMIISIGIITLLSSLTFFAIKNTKPTYADPYENIREIISNATNLFLNSNSGIDYKNKLYLNKIVEINSNILISEGILEESYFVENLGKEKNVENIEIIIILDEEGFLSYSINIV